MAGLTETQVLLGLVALAIILVAANVAADLARRLGQSEVLGDLLAGVVLGPSVLGALAPQIYHQLFLTGPVSNGLSLLSWIGVVLLLLMAGMEVDIQLLRHVGKASALAGGLAIVSSLAVGIVFAHFSGPPLSQDALFLGIVLSCTAEGIVASFLLEHGLARRSFAQVILVAGAGSETMAWLLVALASSIRSGSLLLAGRSLLAALVFFVLAATLGRRFTYWAMRRVTDVGRLALGPLSLVLVLMLVAAATTQFLGLHPVLGAFVFGIILARSPRTPPMLKERLNTVTSSIFGPVFFVLAGMQVDILNLSFGAVMVALLLLLLVATAVKIGSAMLGGLAGGLRAKEALLVGLGLNFKGKTDVIVAIIGVELGLLSGQAFTMYAVIALVTVLFSMPLFTRLERTVHPSAEERARLEREEAERRAYVPKIERVLLPMAPALLPGLASQVVERLAHAKQGQNQIFDVTHLATGGPVSTFPAACAPVGHEAANPEAAKDRLEAASELKNVEVVGERAQKATSTLRPILDAAKSYDLIAMGACAEPHHTTISFGRLQDAIIQRAKTDILIVTSRQQQIKMDEVRRILVPVNGLEYSMAAGDIAASLASSLGGASGPEVVLLHVVTTHLHALFRQAQDRQQQREVGMRVVSELEFRVNRLGVNCAGEVRIAQHPWNGILMELRRGDYQLVVMGGYNRSSGGRPYLGATIRTVLSRSAVPTVLLLTQQRMGAVGTAA